MTFPHVANLTLLQFYFVCSTYKMGEYSNFHKGFLIPHIHDVSSCRKFDFTTILFFLFQFERWFTKFQNILRMIWNECKDFLKMCSRFTCYWYYYGEIPPTHLLLKSPKTHWGTNGRSEIEGDYSLVRGNITKSRVMLLKNESILSSLKIGDLYRIINL